MDDLNDLYQELILDHGMEPRNCHCLEGASSVREGFNPLCGDRIKLYLKVRDDVIVAASFEGKGCAISTASASLMTEHMIGKTVNEAKQLFELFQTMLTSQGGCEGKNCHEKLGKLLAFAGVKGFPSRIKCATLPWHTLCSALERESESEKVVTTE